MNPNAAPFTPRVYQQQHHVYQQQPQQMSSHQQYFQNPRNIFYQQPLQQSYESNYANEHSVLTSGDFLDNERSLMPMQDVGVDPSCNASSVLSAELLEKMYAHPNCAAMFEIQIGMEQLQLQHNEFDIWANAIRDRLTGRDISGDGLTIAADIIIEMAVMVDDCQYVFSKLCVFLNESIRQFAEKCLLPELNEFGYQHSNDYSYLNDRELQNFVLFLAELYDKIEINGRKMSQLSALIFEQVNLLLKYQPIHDAIIKSVIRTLKLVGRHLESEQGPLPLDGIFATLNTLYKSKGISDNVKHQVLALNQLRQNHWGVTTVEYNSVSAVPSSSSILIIGPDGKPLTEEECEFLDECNDNLGTNSPSGSYNGALEDDDVLEDYEKFLQATAESAAEKALEKLSFDDEDELGSPRSSLPSHSSFSPLKESESTNGSLLNGSTVAQEQQSIGGHNNMVIIQKKQRK